MANPEHVALVRKGRAAIAKWRQGHLTEPLDLRGADLRGAELVGADLFGANLRGANLSDANLSRAILYAADLSEADLRRVDFSYAVLIGANLSKTNLFEANLTWASLSGANLSQADLGLTLLSGGHGLSGVLGLRNALHTLPSSIGVDTLIASVRGAGDRLPELMAFFRGAGVPEELLKEVPRIVAEVKYYSCFISYGQPDVEFAKKLKGDLEARGLSCWLYDMDKTVGKPTWSEIEQKLDEYERMVVVCSIKALIRDGLKKEVDKQIDKNPDKLIPVSLDDDWKQDGFKAEWAGRDLKKWLIDRNWADFSGWERDPSRYDKALEDLLKGLGLEKSAD